MTPHPPRLALRFLNARLSPEWRDFVIGDLEEEFAARSVDSRIAAHAWFWRQAVRCLAAPPPVHRGSLALQRSRGDSRFRINGSREGSRVTAGLGDDLQRDLRYALRMLSRAPAFTIVAVLTLGLGSGATTSIFTVVHGVLLQPLPYRDSDRLVRIVEHVPAGESVTGQAERVVSLATDEFVEWRTRAKTLSQAALRRSALADPAPSILPVPASAVLKRRPNVGTALVLT